MRIATWNCHGNLAGKWGVIESLDADIVIVQESDSNTSAVANEHGWEALWSGVGKKGVGLLARPGWSIEAFPHEEPWWLPAKITGPESLTVVGFWAMPPKVAQQTYTCQATILVERLADFEAPIVVGGDFNSWEAPAHLAMIASFERLGMHSAYHQHRGIKRNDEQEPTHFHQWNYEKRYHIDLVFVPTSWATSAVDVGTFEQYTMPRISDHVPVIVTTASP